MTTKIKYWIYLGLLYPIALLPLPILYVISDFLYLIIGKMLHYRDKVVTENLTTSFPDKSDEEISKIKHDFYRHLCDIIVESIKLLHISDKTLRKHVSVENYAIVNQYAAADDAVILFLGHYGNWELVPATTLYYTPKMASYHIYKPLRDKAADMLMYKIRSRLSSRGIAQKQAVRHLLEINSTGRPFMVGFIADQRSNSDVSHQSVEFLHHQTPYNVGGETIGRKIGAKYLYLDVSQSRRGHYTLTFVPMDAKGDPATHPYTRLYMEMLQHTIERNPALWLWSHRRWLYK